MKELMIGSELEIILSIVAPVNEPDAYENNAGLR